MAEGKFLLILTLVAYTTHGFPFEKPKSDSTNKEYNLLNNIFKDENFLNTLLSKNEELKDFEGLRNVKELQSSNLLNLKNNDPIKLIESLENIGRDTFRMYKPWTVIMQKTPAVSSTTESFRMLDTDTTTSSTTSTTSKTSKTSTTSTTTTTKKPEKTSTSTTTTTTSSTEPSTSSTTEQTTEAITSEITETTAANTSTEENTETTVISTTEENDKSLSAPTIYMGTTRSLSLQILVVAVAALLA